MRHCDLIKTAIAFPSNCRLLAALALSRAIAPVGLVTLLIGLPSAIWEKRPIAGLDEAS